MRSKKGQAAIEFLVTYGWAILGVLVAVGALAYFGVFNPSKYVNDECNFGDQWHCEDFIMSSNGNVTVRLRNNFGTNLNMSCQQSYLIIDEENGSCSRIFVAGPPACSASYCEVPAGSTVDVTFALSPWTPNDRLRGKAAIRFSKVGDGSPWHIQTGDIYGTVTDKTG